MKITLLGPQRRPTLDKVVAALAPSGPVATITAGWQEREPEDHELSGLLAGADVNLKLHARWLDVLEKMPEFAADGRRLQGAVDEAQELYLLRLDHALQAVAAIGRRETEPLQEEIHAEAIAAVAELDAAHLERIGDLRGAFWSRWRPHDQPVVAAHRAEVAQVLAEAGAVVIAGGHVGVLADVLHLFNVAPVLRGPVVAWSAGAMALTDRIVLFHDRAPQGPGHPELYGAGLSLLNGVVALPHAKARLLLGDAARMATFARRFAPARCLLLEAGSRVDLDTSDIGTAAGWPPGARVLGADGHVSTLAAA